VFGQSGLFWGALKLLKNSSLKFEKANTYNLMYRAGYKLEK
jgi:hypothetical protein